MTWAPVSNSRAYTRHIPLLVTASGTELHCLNNELMLPDQTSPYCGNAGNIERVSGDVVQWISIDGQQSAEVYFKGTLQSCVWIIYNASSIGTLWRRVINEWRIVKDLEGESRGVI